MTSGAAGLLRQPEEPRATYLELFFDLVFVFALARLSQGLLEHLSWSGAFQTLVLLLALWAVWGHTAGLTDRLDPQQPPTQLLVIGTMLGTLLMAAWMAWWRHCCVLRWRRPTSPYVDSRAPTQPIGC